MAIGIIDIIILLEEVMMKRLFIILVILVAVASCIVLYANQYNPMFNFGQKLKSIYDKNDETIVAIIDDTKITMKQFEAYKYTLNDSKQKMFSDREILDMLIDKELFYKEALNNGVSVSDSVVDETIKSQKELITKNEHEYNQIKDYIAGLGITEEQYWENSKTGYKRALICGQYKKILKKAYAEKNNIKDQNELNKQFEEYYKSYIKELKSRSKVEYYDIK